MAVPKTEAQPVARPARGGLIDRFSVVLVAVAATMWASDTYFRAQLIGHLTPSQIVVIEDALVSLFLVAFLLRGLPEMRRLDRRGWLAIGFIAVGPQAVATILFTTSFSYRHFAETFVLQQTQPLIAILLAWIILGERRRPWFWPAAALAIVGVYMVVFSQNLMAPFSDLQHGRLEAGLYALGAAALWASGTVLGRFVLGKLSFPTTTALRFTLALPLPRGRHLSFSRDRADSGAPRPAPLLPGTGEHPGHPGDDRGNGFPGGRDLYRLGAAAVWLQPAALSAAIHRHRAADRGDLRPELDEGADAARGRPTRSRRVTLAAS